MLYQEYLNQSTATVVQRPSEKSQCKPQQFCVSASLEDCQVALHHQAHQHMFFYRHHEEFCISLLFDIICSESVTDDVHTLNILLLLMDDGTEPPIYMFKFSEGGRMGIRIRIIDYLTPVSTFFALSHVTSCTVFPAIMHVSFWTWVNPGQRSKLGFHVEGFCKKLEVSGV